MKQICKNKIWGWPNSENVSQLKCVVLQYTYIHTYIKFKVDNEYILLSGNM